MTVRQIVLDTETTGLEVSRGNRLVEIGCIELVQRRPTGRHFHRYLNPQRAMEDGAREVTGITEEFLADKPLFEHVVEEFLAFVRGAELVIHNAAFDVGFLDHELSLLGDGYGRIGDRAQVLDSLELARQRFPGQRNSLDALCRRLGVDNSHRQLHGALLDAQILADVYIALTSGQEEIGFGDVQAAIARPATVATFAPASGARPRISASAEEAAAHARRLETLRKKAGRAAWDQAVEPPPMVEAGRKGGYGNAVVIQHGSTYQTVYGHMSRFAKGIRSGVAVKQGQIIGYVGTTGLATGPHLHYEFHINGKYVDPLSAKLPMADPLAGPDRKRFLAQTQPLMARMDQEKPTSLAMNKQQEQQR